MKKLLKNKILTAAVVAAMITSAAMAVSCAYAPADELTKEERINNIKNNDKSGYGDIIRDLNENKIGFKSDRTRRDYIVARALKSQGHNIDMSLLNGSDEDRQKFYDYLYGDALNSTFYYKRKYNRLYNSLYANTEVNS